MPFCRHTSQALTSAKMNLPDALVALARAHDKPGRDRLAELMEARHDLLSVIAEINRAIDTEVKARGHGAEIFRITTSLALNEIDADEARTQLRRAGVDPAEIEDHIGMEIEA